MNPKTLLIRRASLAVAYGLLLSACGPDGSTGPEAPLPALEKWTFSGKEIGYKSGIAVRSRDMQGNPVPGVTVWITDQSIDCSDAADRLPVLQGGWLGIKYPDISIGKRPVRVIVGYWSLGGDINGNIDDMGSAILSEADTSVEKSVSGSLDFHSDVMFEESGFGKADIKGSFTVPYCPQP